MKEDRKIQVESIFRQSGIRRKKEMREKVEKLFVGLVRCFAYHTLSYVYYLYFHAHSRVAAATFCTRMHV